MTASSATLSRRLRARDVVLRPLALDHHRVGILRTGRLDRPLSTGLDGHVEGARGLGLGHIGVGRLDQCSHRRQHPGCLG